MKYLVYFINISLLAIIPLNIITAHPDVEMTAAKKEVKKLNSVYVESHTSKEPVKIEEPQEEVVKKEESEKKVEFIAPAIPIENKHEGIDITNIPTEKPTIQESNLTGLEVYTGTMSGYGPDCYGCSGLVAYRGIDVRNNIYYNDSEYGRVRIVAGDRQIPFGTILKVESNRLPTQNVIVLDRGGDIGFNGIFLFDLLFDSQASARNFGIAKNTTFTVLRKGF